MTARLRLLVPEGTTNYIENPSARYDTSGVNAVGSTVTRSLEKARFGVACFKVVTDGLALNEGFYYRVSALQNVQKVVTVSAYVRGTGYVRIRVIDNPFGKQWSSKEIELLSDRWQRIEVTGRTSGSNDVRLYLETNGNAAQGVTFYADGLQLELQEAATTYCDGDQEGCRWNLLAHGSQSIRSPYTRAGGRWLDIAGPSCEAQNLYMTVVGGLGMASIKNQTQPYADAPGDYFQSTKILSRPITLSFFTKRPYRPRTNRLPTLYPLHQLRQQLLDVVKPDRTAGQEAFTLEYTDGEISLYLKARYDSGMEGEWDVRNEFINAFPLRLLSVSPFFLEDDQEVSALNFRTTHTINYIIQRINGEWSEMNGGFDGQVLDIVIGPRGQPVAVGSFILANNDVNAIDPMIFANRIAWWDGEKWNQYGVGANNTIRAVAFGPDGKMYVVGDFTFIGGVAANYIAYLETDGTWHAMGLGLGGPGYAVAVASNNDVYVGFNGTTAGTAIAYYVARYDGSYHPLGSNGGLNATVASIAISKDGTKVYLGGYFTDEHSNPGILELNYVALYEPFFNSFDEMGTGFSDEVLRVRITDTGRVYTVGNYIESFDTALVLLYIAYWNGASWFGIGEGTDNTTRALAVSERGNLLLGGDFQLAGGVYAAYAALYNNSTYVNMDISLSDAVYAAAIDKMENLFLAPNGTTAEFAAITTVENIGSAEANPTLYITGPATLIWVENQTTQKRVYINLDISDNEEIFIDFGQGTVESNIRGNLAYAVNPGSDFRAWTLAPGENKISLLMTADVAATAHLSYTPQHWSADATARNEAL